MASTLPMVQRYSSLLITRRPQTYRAIRRPGRDIKRSKTRHDHADVRLRLNLSPLQSHSTSFQAPAVTAASTTIDSLSGDDLRNIFAFVPSFDRSAAASLLPSPSEGRSLLCIRLDGGASKSCISATKPTLCMQRRAIRQTACCSGACKCLHVEHITSRKLGRLCYS